MQLRNSAGKKGMVRIEEGKGEGAWVNRSIDFERG